MLAALLLVPVTAVTAGETGGSALQLSRLERNLRGQPEAAVAAIASLLPLLDGGDLVAALEFRGEMCERIPDDACLEDSAFRLDHLAARNQASAAAMAALVRSLPEERLGTLRAADRKLAEATSLLPKDADERLQVALALQHAHVKDSIGRFDEGVALSQRAVVLADHLQVPWLRADSRNELARALWRAQQSESAQRIDDAAMEIAHGDGDALAESHAQITRSMLMADLGREDEDLRATREAIRLARQAGDTRYASICLADLSDHYLKVRDYATALEVAREALPLARQVHNQDSESVALFNGGLALIHLGRHDDGMAMVRDSMSEDERSGAISSHADTMHELGDALEEVGRLDEAWTALREFRTLADESFRHEQQQAVLELEESFDAERRRTALDLLRTENGVKEAQLGARDLERRFAVGAAFAALASMLLAIALLRRMRRSHGQLQLTNERLRHSSESDPLTGLANRRHFLDVMDRMSTPSGGFEGALLLIDLDHFKVVNDQRGHAAGDAVLVEIARRLRELLQAGDLPVRWGGEEFLVVLPAGSADRVRTLADRLLEAIGRMPVATGTGSVAVTASVGFAAFPLAGQPHALDWEQAMVLVDQAMYFAKSEGRNRACGVLRFPSGAAGGGSPGLLRGALLDGAVDLAQLVGPLANGGEA